MNRSVVLLGASLIVVGVAAWALYPKDQTQSEFRRQIMSAVDTRHDGDFNVDVTDLIKERVRQQSIEDPIETLAALGLEEKRVVRHDKKFLKDYNADSYRIFSCIVDRFGPVTYWEITVYALYKSDALIDLFAVVNHNSL